MEHVVHIIAFAGILQTAIGVMIFVELIGLVRSLFKRGPSNKELGQQDKEIHDIDESFKHDDKEEDKQDDKDVKDIKDVDDSLSNIDKEEKEEISEGMKTDEDINSALENAEGAEEGIQNPNVPIEDIKDKISKSLESVARIKRDFKNIISLINQEVVDIDKLEKGIRRLQIDIDYKKDLYAKHYANFLNKNKDKINDLRKEIQTSTHKVKKEQHQRILDKLLDRLKFYDYSSKEYQVFSDQARPVFENMLNAIKEFKEGKELIRRADRRFGFSEDSKIQSEVREVSKKLDKMTDFSSDEERQEVLKKVHQLKEHVLALMNSHKKILRKESYLANLKNERITNSYALIRERNQKIHNELVNMKNKLF